MKRPPAENLVATTSPDRSYGRPLQNAWPQTPNPPAITGVFVSGLAHPDFLVEMDAVAVVPQ